jgi:hypothetical protein
MLHRPFDRHLHLAHARLARRERRLSRGELGHGQVGLAPRLFWAGGHREQQVGGGLVLALQRQHGVGHLIHTTDKTMKQNCQ